MKKARGKTNPALWILMLVVLIVPQAMFAGNDVMGELQFEGKSKVERTSGVWIDGGYVGYLKELHGSKRVLLLPGEHVITVRQDGFQDFSQRVTIQPGEKQVVRVEMQKAPTEPMPKVTATVKIEVNPNRAAVFVDGQPHDEPDQMRNDEAITQRLVEAGYIVIRFHHKENWLAIVQKHPDVFGVPNP